jgi:glucuronoarabinoxylan endo-1,4-beta-xylanase
MAHGKKPMSRIRRQSTPLILLLVCIIIQSRTDIFAATGKVKAKETHQTMEGFGASIAWADDQLTSHPKKAEIYDYLFNDLGLDILRLRNIYRNNPTNFAPTIAEIVETMYALSPKRPTILLSSWSPPANLKSNNSENGGGNATLKKVDGQFVYGAFAKYWVDALSAYKSIGVEPDFIGLQNEPTYDATWESCRFEATENSTVAGYKQALDSVYYALQQANLSSKIIGPEVHGIGYSTFQNYAGQFNHGHLDGYAYHLYHGESDNVSDNHNPDLFKTNLSNVAKTSPSKPIFQTEYDRGDWFNTVWLMHNCLVNGDVSAYLWWELVWGTGGKPLIEMQSTSYTLTKYYWAFRQYSKYVDSGWKRVTTEVDTDSLRMSAFIDPDGKKLTLVILNLGTKSDSMSIDIQNFTIATGTVVRTSNSENGAVIDAAYDGKSVGQFPARSISTLSFTGDFVDAVNGEPSGPAEFSLSQNYPNPFNPTTTIEYSIASENFVQLNVYDLLGREIKTLIKEKMPAGKHTIYFEANDLNSGIYFYQIRVGGFIQSKKMILMK